MKKILALVLVLLAAGVTEAVACDGLYVGGKLSYNRYNVNNDTVGGVGLGSGISDTLEDYTFGYGIGLGYRYGNYRIEAEFSKRDDVEKSSYISGVKSVNEFVSKSYMINAYYDIFPYAIITPYVSGGLGASELTYSPASTDSVNETNFTWNVGGGLSWKINNRWNVDLAYRYWSFGKIEHAEIDMHEIYLGLRFVL